MVRRGGGVRGFQTVEPPVFRSFGLGLDRLQTLVAVPWGLHGTMVFRLGPEFNGGFRSVVGLEWNAGAIAADGLDR